MSRQIRHAIVIGSSGFLGSWLVDHLVRENIEVTGISRQDGTVLPSLAKPHRWIEADIVHDNPKHYLPMADVVFFMAGVASVQASVNAPISDLDGNLRAPVSILQVLRERKVETGFIYSSSAAVYGNARTRPMGEMHALDPLSPYGASKLAAETYVRLFARNFAVNAASARPFSVYGPGQSKQVIYDWARKIAVGGKELSFFGTPDVSRDFVHASDAAAAYLRIARYAPMQGESYNVASGTETTLGQLATELLTISGINASFHFSGEVRVGEPVRWQADISALEKLGFHPEIKLTDGLRETYQWANQRAA